MATIVLKEAERPFKLGIILLDVIELLNKYQNQVDRLWLYDRFYMPLKKLYAIYIYIYLRSAYGTLLLFSGLGEFSIQEKGNFNTRYHHISSYIMSLS